MAGATEAIPLHDDPNSAYHGPTMGYLISHKQLGRQIIKSFADRPVDGDILDNQALALLREYVQDTTPEGTQSFLAKYDLLDAPGAEKGDRANKVFGSLIGVAVAKGAFPEDQIEELKVWFGTPEMVKVLEGVEPRVMTKEEREKENEARVVG